jgi:hypothetical protein
VAEGLTIGKVVAWVRRFIEAEYKAMQLAYLHPNTKEAVNAYRRLQTRCDSSPEVRIEFPPPEGPGVAPKFGLDDRRRLAADVRPRDLFQVVRFRSATLGIIDRADVSSFVNQDDRTLHQRWYVADEHGSLKIVARESKSFGAGQPKPWRHVDGTEVGGLEGPIEAVQLQAPPGEHDRADYDATAEAVRARGGVVKQRRSPID